MVWCFAIIGAWLLFFLMIYAQMRSAGKADDMMERMAIDRNSHKRKWQKPVIKRR